MKLVLMRHGEAEGLHTSDAERALTERGKQQAAQTAEWLHEKGVGTLPCHLLCSPYRRAQETAAVLAARLGLEAQVVNGVTPDADPRQAVSRIEAVLGANPDSDSTIVLVTHMSFVAELAAWLEDGMLTRGQPFSLAEARLLELPVLGPSTAVVKHRYIPNY